MTTVQIAVRLPHQLVADLDELVAQGVYASRARPLFGLVTEIRRGDRINIYEQWESVEAVEASRGSGPSSGQASAIRNSQVFQYEIASSRKL